MLIIACLAGQPTKCDAFQIPFERPTGIMVCMRDAQFRLAEWSRSKPDWKIKKWTCGLPKA
ncbi:MAG: hypothetical protein ACR2Q4_03370 [Geminicoccaceae bacterium]